MLMKEMKMRFKKLSTLAITGWMMSGVLASDMTHEQRVDAVSQQLYVQQQMNYFQENKQSNFFKRCKPSAHSMVQLCKSKYLIRQFS